MKSVISLALLILTGSAMAQSYEVDDIALPVNVAPEVGGLGFTEEGELVVVLRRSGILIAEPNPDPKEFKWRVFAEDSLHNPCGLEIVSKSEMIVSQMEELTRVKDLDGDGLADLYETISDDWGVSGNYHETNTLIPDGKGGWYVMVGTASHNGPTFYNTRGEYAEMGRTGRNFAAVQWKGWVLHVDSDGVTTPFAKGFRANNGAAISPDGKLFVTDNQGDWRGTSPLYHVEKGKFYGHPSSLVWDEAFTKNVTEDPLGYYISDYEQYEEDRTAAAIELPQGFMCNSPSQPLFDTTAGAFGPFAGQVFVGDIAGDRIIRCMLEEVNGVMQGACIKFVDKGLRGGNNRLQFSPDGKSLYVGQTYRGWGKPSEGLQRIRFTGETPFEVKTMSLADNGFKLTFTENVDTKAAADIANYSMRKYWYKSHHQYGSQQHDLEEISVSSVTVLDDNRSVMIEFDGLEEGRIFELNLSPNLLGNDGSAMSQTQLCYTLRKLR